MNTAIFNISLCIFWASIAVFVLVLGPILHPKIFADSEKYLMLGVGASMLAAWNFIRWWGIRSYRKSREMDREEMALRKQIQSPERPREVVNPEFNFEDDAPPIRIPPHPPPPNGTKH